MHDICLSRQADDSPAPHVNKRRHLANPPSPVYVVCVWPLIDLDGLLIYLALIDR